MGVGNPRARRTFAGLATVLAVAWSSASWGQDSDSEDAGSDDVADDGADAEPTEAPASQDAETPECSPACRAGYECRAGSCVSQCNPPCPSGQVCSESRTCEMDPDIKVIAAKNVEEDRLQREERLSGIKGFGGLQFGGGVTIRAPKVGIRLRDPSVWGAFSFAIKGGVFIRQAELSLELSPGTYLPITEQPFGNRTSFLANVGYHGHVVDNFYWPLRAGAGFVADSNSTNLLARIDFFAVSMKTKYVLVDFTFPSIRYESDFDTYHMWTAMFTAGASYIAP